MLAGLFFHISSGVLAISLASNSVLKKNNKQNDQTLKIKRVISTVLQKVWSIQTLFDIVHLKVFC